MLLIGVNGFCVRGCRVTLLFLGYCPIAVLMGWDGIDCCEVSRGWWVSRMNTGEKTTICGLRTL